MILDTMTSLRVFCTVAELRSFTAAARRLNLSPAMVSRHVAHVESRIGSRLLNRTSRHVSLTEAGALYVAQARQLIEGLDEVEAAIGNVTQTPRGTLRLSAPVWVATPCFSSLLADYNRRYPDVCLDMDLSGRRVNLVDEGFDLALRATDTSRLDPGLVARPLMQMKFRLMASPAYLNRAGHPRTLADLNGHALLRYSGIAGNESIVLGDAGDRQTVNFHTVLRSENETLLHLAALEGMGLVLLPTWMVQRDIDAERLTIVLPDAFTLNSTLHAVYPSRKFLSAKVRSFVDFIASRDPVA
ncbi:LysR family transcriptional regulator [Xanthomonas phaseoli]|uniref:LysR family transcriptional regulator n=1 Tax=Xanthomonas manihotis TaxID=43353 RepID=A0A8I1XIH4_XANMN|nr:LysR family transcriptional regulator [Xanthomonas phaseoli]KUF37646.1 LysR family transcriptional regulator [Xanthomonas phaseoli pv. manihotis]MBO9721063.1 LysR family transcriptional regulator [Xanthomonas phaseoli pv. manihotis]MBO9757134.1 LysR family transcriptional regulator [Xanthomonas phaseoli pv. manihotis]MBO9758150.1 LysR family transcriptional regulator [Xanthomonas phaseoli pv. manihotis]MBO9762200.1 LysR family transcriptional regulator [Xanthomonas phaseoli pv. manihotis]